jgi:DNA-binding transcriptional LysR family regulator
VDFHGIKLFRDVARTGSLTEAARLNGVSQSAASQRVAELERAFHVKLLDRTTRPLKLTEAGQVFSQFCRDVLRRKEELEDELDRLLGRLHGTVRVACIYSVGLSQMAQLEGEYRRRYPEVDLAVEYLRPERVYEQILADRADLGLISYPESSREIAVIPWREEVMVVAAAPSHPLAGRSVIAIAELSDQDFIGFDDDLPIARELKRFFREHGISVNLVMHFDNVLAIKEAVELGSGISILPEPTLREEVQHGRLVAIPLEAPGLRRPLGVIHRRRKQFTRPMRAFLELIEAPLPDSPASK